MTDKIIRVLNKIAFVIIARVFLGLMAYVLGQPIGVLLAKTIGLPGWYVPMIKGLIDAAVIAMIAAFPVGLAYVIVETFDKKPSKEVSR